LTRTTPPRCSTKSSRVLAHKARPVAPPAWAAACNHMKVRSALRNGRCYMRARMRKVRSAGRACGSVFVGLMISSLILFTHLSPSPSLFFDFDKALLICCPHHVLICLCLRRATRPRLLPLSSSLCLLYATLPTTPTTVCLTRDICTAITVCIHSLTTGSSSALFDETYL
jgi:hypothetical protein